MSLQLTTDPKLKSYLTNVVSQLKGRSRCSLHQRCKQDKTEFTISVPRKSKLSCFCFVLAAEWLFECTVQKLVLVITCLETNEVLERWQFDIECDKSAKESRSVLLTSFWRWWLYSELIFYSHRVLSEQLQTFSVAKVGLIIVIWSGSSWGL